MQPKGATRSFEDGRRRARTDGPVLFLVLRCEVPRATPWRHELTGLDEVVLGRAEEEGRRRAGRRLEIGLSDPWMSGLHARLRRADGGWEIEDAGSKNGTFVNGAAVTKAPLGDGDVVEVGGSFFLFRSPVPRGAEPDAQPTAQLPGLATLSPALGRELDRLREIARWPLAVVARGESGTGKELIARAVHELSRRSGRFVAVNCGALPRELVESELFGHKKGSFTGAADDRRGLVPAADRGTLFLDEIGDLALPSQTALLRVLQEREVLPIGATTPIKVDLRVVAATHRDLDQLVAEERFRADLLARLAGFTIVLPPLREHREDLGLLVGALLQRLPDGVGDRVTFTREAGRALMRHRWPLNVRELERTLLSAAALSGGGPIGIEHLPPAVASDDRAAVAARATSRPGPPLTDRERRHRDEVEALLVAHRGNLASVARATGKARTQIWRWVKRYGLDPERFRD